MRIFLSYRRGDAGGYAGRLTDVLQQHLGPKSVFQDVTAIVPGEDYTAAIDSALSDSDAVLVVIGPGWLNASTAHGTRRLLEADDYVRLELTRALMRDVPVIPVLVGGAALPAATDLPIELRGLSQRQAVMLRDESWHRDVDGLVRSLRGEPAVPVKRRRRWLVIPAAMVLAGAGATAWWQLGAGADGQGNSSPGGTVACTAPSGQGWNPIVLSKNPMVAEKVEDGSLIFRVKDAHWRAHGGKWQVILATSMEAANRQGGYDDAYRYKYLVVGQRAFTPACFSMRYAGDSFVDAQTVGDALIGFDVRCKPVGYIALVIENGDTMSVTPDTLRPGAC